MSEPNGALGSSHPPRMRVHGAWFASLVLAALFCLSLAIWWHGLGPHDETRYISAAIGWLEDGPRLGPRHWDLRHLYVLPMAASFLIFGKSEISASLPSVLYAGGLVAVTYYYGRRLLGATEALVAGALVATSAFFIAIPIEVEVYGAEIFFAALAIWLFLLAGRSRASSAYFFSSGVFCGLAWTLRESAVYIPAALGIIALMQRNGRLVAAVALSLGFGVILAGELIFYYIATGDPFHRYIIDLGHRRGGPTLVSFADDRFPLWRHLTRPVTDTLTAPFVGPFVMISVFLAVLFRRKIFGGSDLRRRTLICFAFAGLVGMALCGYLFYQAMPHYYPVLSYAALLTTSVGIVEISRTFGKATAIAAAVFVYFGNLAVGDFKILNYYNEARFLVTYASRSSEPIFTDSGTARRAYALMALEGVSSTDAEKKIIAADVPPPCALFFENHRAALPNGRKSTLVRQEVLNKSYVREFFQRLGIGGDALRRVIAPPRPSAIVRYTPAPEQGDCQ